MPNECDVQIDGRLVRVRDAGDPKGSPIVYFHGTPGSRLDMVVGEDVATAAGVRLISFDRPGYGGSTPSPFSLTSIAGDVMTVAEALGLDRFATLGYSGGGPFALATAARGGAPVTKVGLASSAGPFQLVPGALELLDDNDTQALSHLPGDPAKAADMFTAGFEPLAKLARSGEFDRILEMFSGAMSARDVEVAADPAVKAAFEASWSEGLRLSASGGGWDNVSWVGDWDFDVAEVRCPVRLWYGNEDHMALPANGGWFVSHLAEPQLTMFPGEGHLMIYEHLPEILSELTSAH